MFETARAFASSTMCDDMGHVSVASQVALFEVAARHLMHCLGVSSVAQDGLGWADVRYELDFRAEVQAGALLVVRSNVERVGRTSLTARHRLSGPDNDEAYTELLAVTVRFDLRERRAVDLPSEIMQRWANIG